MPVRADPDLLLKSLADPTRRTLFERLCNEGELNVRVLTEQSGVSQPAVSKHLGVLKRAGLVTERRDGREVHYGARPKALTPLVTWLQFHTRFWEGRFDRLESLLKRMDQ
ncbi:MAG: helix-turn-helix transcriptional regulator [Ideonella sp.]|jgi:DNA-binding transcriptional ArsR family regulator|nr:helix-turn-helix transcriptional regulator [Ideonella sp.]